MKIYRYVPVCFVFIFIIHFSGTLFTGVKATADEINEKYLKEGDKAFKENDFSGAIKYYKKFIKKNPESVEANLKLGQAYCKDEQTPEAEKLYNEFLQKHPDNEEILFELLKLYEGNRKHLFAIKTLDAFLHRNPDNVSALKYLANIHLKLVHYSRASEIFQRIITLQPDSIPTINEIGASYIKMKEFDEAYTLFQKIIELKGDSDDINLGLTHLMLGQILETQKKYDEAFAEYNKSLESNPHEIEAMNALGKLYIQCGKYQEASRKFSEALRIDPQNDIASTHFELLKDIGAVMEEVTEVEIENIDIKKVIEKAPSIDEHPDVSAIYLLDRAITELTPGGIVRRTEHQIIKIFNEQALDTLGEFYFPFNTVQENLEVNLARTILPDGTIVYAALNAIHDITPPSYAYSNMYTDEKLRVVSMPALQSGAILEIKATTEDKYTNIRSGLGISSKWFQKDIPVLRGEYIVKLPLSQEIKWKTENCDIQPVVTSDKHEKRYRWSLINIPPLAREPGMPPTRNLISQVIIFSTTSWEDVCKWFINLTKDRQKATLPIKKKVKELTGSLKSRQEKIKAIYEYVATQIRYVAIELEEGAYQPSTPEDVFTYKYGDCKDKVSLMITMLDEIGVEAFYALISPAPRGDINQEIPSMGQFNHVIAAVPQNDGWLWLDPTAETCAFGHLPAADENRTTLVAGKKWCKLVHIPASQPEKNTKSIDWTVNIADDGSASGAIHAYWSGEEAMFARKSLQMTSEKDMKKQLLFLVDNSGPVVTIDDYTITNLNDISNPLEVTINFSSDTFGISAGDITTLPIPLLENELCERFIATDERQFDLHLGCNSLIKQKVSIHLPNTMNLKKCPERIEKNYSFGKLIQNVEHADNSSVQFSQEIAILEPIIAVEKYNDFRDFLISIAHQSRQYLIISR